MTLWTGSCGISLDAGAQPVVRDERSPSVASIDPREAFDHTPAMKALRSRGTPVGEIARA